VNFADAITVIVTSPFLLAVADGGMGSNNMVVALPFIRIDRGPHSSEGVNVLFQGRLIGVMGHSEPNLSALAANRAHNRRAVIVISTVARLFIGPSSGRILGIGVKVTFFPPRSGTSRQFPSPHLLRVFGVDVVPHWLEFLGGPRARWAD